MIEVFKFWVRCQCEKNKEWHYWNLALCHLPWQMAKAWSADGKGFAICQQMANSLSETLPVKASLPSAGWWQRACGFAICWQMAKPLNGVSPVRRLTAYFVVCQQMAKAAGSLPSTSRWQRLHALPSASRWQRALPSAGRWQRAQIGQPKFYM